MGGPSATYSDTCLIFNSFHKSNKKVLKHFWVFFISLCAIYLILGMSAPLFSYIAYSDVDYIYKMGRKLCVARPSRCIWILNDHTALCAKCIGMYFGAMVAACTALPMHKIKYHSLIGAVSFVILLSVCLHSIFRAAYGGLLFPVWLSGILGVAAGIAFVTLIWSAFSKWEEKTVQILRKRWVLATALVVGINILGFSSAFAAPARVQPDEIKVTSGTPVILEVDVGFSAEEVREGDSVVLLVQRTVYVNKILVVRRGTAARARIVAAKAASGWGSAGEIGLEIRSVEAVDGSEIMLRGRASRKGESEHGAATALGVGAGILCLPLAVAGFAVTGEEGKFPPGYEVVAHTAGDHFVQILPEDQLEKIGKKQEDAAIKASEKFKKHIEDLRKEKAEEARRRNEQM